MIGLPKVWLRTAKFAYAVAVVMVLGWALFDARGAFFAWRDWITAPGVTAFVAAWCIMALLLGFGWSRVLIGYLGLRLPVREWLPIQASAWAGRYLPGKIGLLAGKLTLLERDGVGWRGLGFTVLFEQLAFVVLGAAVALTAPLPFERIGLPESLGVSATGFFLRIALAAGVLVAFLLASRYLASKAGVQRRPSSAETLAVLAVYVLAHVVVGIGFHMVVLIFVEPALAPSFWYSIGLLAAANIAGILAFFAPAGLGVRDGVLAVGLTTYLPFQEALGVAALLRILTLIADLIFIAAGGGLARLWPKAPSAH